MSTDIRLPAEVKYWAELTALAAADDAPRPTGWKLSPRAVEAYVMGADKPVGGVTITPKYIGDRALIQVAIATLASDRALLLTGEPGTAKSWLSEHLAAAISGTSSLIVQGTAGTTEEHIKYGWNYALLLAEGPSPRALVPSPVYRAMQAGQFARLEEVTRTSSEIQDALISILSEKQIGIPELGEILPAARGFNIIATANTRDRGVNEMSAALKRRFNFVTVPVVEDLEQEIQIVTKREAELRGDYQVGVQPPAELAKLLVTLFQELRAGVTKDGKTKDQAAGLGAVDRRGDQRPVQQHDPGAALRQRQGDTGRSPALDGWRDRERRTGRPQSRPRVLRDRGQGAERPVEGALHGWHTSVEGLMHLFPVRHHSPRASVVVRAFLDAVQPEMVLIEGPIDATPLIDVLADKDTEPPIAILGFRTDDTPGSALWPFASYSPEYVAIRWAQQHGRRAAFIDIATGTSLAVDQEPGHHLADDDAGSNLNARCAERTGFRSFDEFWDASFETPRHDPESFRAALIAYADLVRQEDRGTFHRARDAYMSREIDKVVASGVSSNNIAVILGAAHAAALAAGDVDRSLEATLPAPVQTSVTLIPFSFPRLAQQLGYGAGNRGPRFYQRAHDAGGDYHRATLETLITFTEHLRLRGFAASLADTIEAYRLAITLADMRGKSGPGLDEVREAAVATMCHGDAAHVDSFLWSAVVGSHVGRVAARIGRNALQEEFWREIRERRLPGTDAPESFALHLHNEVEIGTSVFLHRLRIGAIPYATFQGTRSVAAGSSKTDEPAGGVAALTRARESWEAQWTPATDVGLVERIVHGNSLQDVATRVLAERLQSASTTGEAAEVLMESVIAACPQTLSSALHACDTLAATDDDLPSLAAACRALSGLSAYGSSRSHVSGGADSAIATLCRKTFSRAIRAYAPPAR